MINSLRTKSSIVAITCLAAGSLWVGVSQAAPRSTPAADAAVPASAGGTAHLFATVAGTDPGPFGTSLEGAAFDANGRFYFVDTTSPSSSPLPRPRHRPPPCTRRPISASARTPTPTR